MAAEQEQLSVICTPGQVAAQFNWHGNCAAVTTDRVVSSKLLAFVRSLTTFLSCILTNETEYNGGCFRCFTASDIKGSCSILTCKAINGTLWPVYTMEIGISQRAQVAIMLRWAWPQEWSAVNLLCNKKSILAQALLLEALASEPDPLWEEEGSGHMHTFKLS